jgi:hypothetical protein
MFWSIAGSLLVLVIVALVVAIGLFYIHITAIETARALKLEREGKIVKAWVVFANDNLYRKNPPTHWWNALFVCTFEQLPDLDQTLEEWAEAIRRFKVKDPNSHEEDAIAAVLRTQIGYPHPIRIPKRITGQVKGYFISFPVLCNLLPERKLTRPYVYCKFYKGQQRDDGECRMVPYPRDERTTKKAPVRGTVD